MGIKPKAGSKEELNSWILDYATQQSKGTEESTFKLSSATESKSEDVRILPHLPRLSIFSGDDSQKSHVSLDIWKFEEESQGFNILDKIDFTGTYLDEKDFDGMRQLLQKWSSIFSHSDIGVECTNLVEHKIHLTDARYLLLLSSNNFTGSREDKNITIEELEEFNEILDKFDVEISSVKVKNS
ncbi:hypothetical protein LOTGIDRAFT_171380 [Lottia gigantea]|uniref:Uncharacterized protein n=1 Tax=Lottia gigantea TaxID=225164 RepID=V4CM99_LOTGI|nr:hypothetical protein LOTGIDRAFT_171380 [Lottia gigantea]ESP03440.1 hypothetical protein LOTGIDRAFT_171380 [Lottia gigantea]